MLAPSKYQFAIIHNANISPYGFVNDCPIAQSLQQVICYTQIEFWLIDIAIQHGMQKGLAGDELVLCNAISLVKRKVCVTHSFFINNIQYVTSVNKSTEGKKDLEQKSRQGACLGISTQQHSTQTYIPFTGHTPSHSLLSLSPLRHVLGLSFANKLPRVHKRLAPNWHKRKQTYCKNNYCERNDFITMLLKKKHPS